MVKSNFGQVLIAGLSDRYILSRPNGWRDYAGLEILFISMFYQMRLRVFVKHNDENFRK